MMSRDSEYSRAATTRGLETGIRWVMYCKTVETEGPPNQCNRWELFSAESPSENDIVARGDEGADEGEWRQMSCTQGGVGM